MRAPASAVRLGEGVPFGQGIFIGVFECGTIIHSWIERGVAAFVVNIALITIICSCSDVGSPLRQAEGVRCAAIWEGHEPRNLRLVKLFPEIILLG